MMPILFLNMRLLKAMAMTTSKMCLSFKLFFLSHMVGWVRRVLVVKGLAHVTETTVMICNGYFLQRNSFVCCEQFISCFSYFYKQLQSFHFSLSSLFSIEMVSQIYCAHGTSSKKRKRHKSDEEGKKSRKRCVIY